MDIVQQLVSFDMLFQPVFEDMEERLVIDELGCIGFAQAVQRCENIGLGIVGSDLHCAKRSSKPAKERRAVVTAANLQVKFDVGYSTGPEPSQSENWNCRPEPQSCPLARCDKACRAENWHG